MVVSVTPLGQRISIFLHNFFFSFGDSGGIAGIRIAVPADEMIASFKKSRLPKHGQI
jgi:hypothetical protein